MVIIIFPETSDLFLKITLLFLISFKKAKMFERATNFSCIILLYKG